MSYRRDPSAPRSALLLLALLLGFGSATVPAWSLDLGNLAREAREAPSALVSRLSALLGLWAEDATPAAPAGENGTTAGNESSGGSSDAGVIIDPNGTPRP
ncbi:MAG TPA: hypothetical protein VGS22_21610 [Thermoanaerobaculia bacterium]|jgi:hypothetical protein|nr:hypothetical protein [Thermoanaerobaculia bacterium]